MSYYDPPKEPEGVCTCDYCDQPIFEGETFYQVHEEKYCESCMQSELRRIALHR